MNHEHDRHCDVVDMATIAERCGVTRDLVSSWVKGDRIPPGRFSLGKSPGWCWLELAEDPLIASYLGASVERSFPEIFEAIPPRGRVSVVTVADGHDYRMFTQRVTRHGCGYVSVPYLVSGGRLVATDDVVEGHPKRPRSEAVGEVSEALQRFAVDRRSMTAKYAEPTVGGSWSSEAIAS